MKLSEPRTPSEIEAYYDFRWRHLRKPWGMPRGSEKDELEESATHITAIDETGQIVGVGRLHQTPEGAAQIRYMATSGAHRGQGVGAAIVAHLEQRAREFGASTMIINARENAFAFYEKLGYEIFADSPTMIGTIAHKLMRKQL
jgi:N-acetylglutamate synthase-like GNAT family acetyltransferase